jgi:hypothetical protein
MDTTTVAPIHSRLAEASRAQLEAWLHDLRSDYADYVTGRAWWTCPTDSPKFVSGEKLSRWIGLISAELKFRDGLAAEAA